MPTINMLPLVSQLSGGDNFPLYAPNQGDARRVSLTDMITYIEENFDGVIANTVKTSPVTVANLPVASTAGSGTRAFVTDANATTFNSVVAGGGANGVPVFSDGTNWRIG